MDCLEQTNDSSYKFMGKTYERDSFECGCGNYMKDENYYCYIIDATLCKDCSKTHNH